MTCRIVLFAATAVCGALASNAVAQLPEPPRFRSAVQLVQVFAVVRDKASNDVDDLTARDFEVRDGNHPVSVTAFAHVRVGPDGQPASSGVPETVHGNVRAFAILYDDLHSEPQRVVAAKRIASRLLSRWVRPQDLVTVRQVTDDGPFTLQPGGDRRLVEKQISDLHGGVTRQPQHDQEVVGRVERLMRLLGALADAIGRTPERRGVIVLISEGITYDIFGVGRGGAGDVLRVIESAITALRRSNVVLYTVDPRGLASAEGIALEAGGSGAPTDAALAQASQNIGNARSSLRHLAEETGGFAAINGNDLDRAADRIGDELSSYYLLGFSPAADVCDGSFRRIHVKVLRRHVRVTARAGYLCSNATR